jgi:uncharacterized membrane protein AbrB (regulator of aidB expression)
MAANDVGHITLTAVEVLSIVLVMAFGSGAYGKWFRVYSIATIVILIAAGILTGVLYDRPHMPFAHLLFEKTLF